MGWGPREGFLKGIGILFPWAANQKLGGARRFWEKMASAWTTYGQEKPSSSGLLNGGTKALALEADCTLATLAILSLPHWLCSWQWLALANGMRAGFLGTWVLNMLVWFRCLYYFCHPPWYKCAQSCSEWRHVEESRTWPDVELSHSTHRPVHRKKKTKNKKLIKICCSWETMEIWRVVYYVMFLRLSVTSEKSKG